MEEKERMEKKEKDRRKEQVKLKSFFRLDESVLCSNLVGLPVSGQAAVLVGSARRTTTC